MVFIEVNEAELELIKESFKVVERIK